MNALDHFLQSNWGHALGWTLIHSLWQLSLIAALLAILLRFFRKKSAQLRYFLSLGGLVVALGWSMFTFVHTYQEFSPIQEASPSLLAARVLTPPA
ncbi:MAG: hypothetical protein AAF206_15305, partial [Bacteroidota bacterium]